MMLVVAVLGIGLLLGWGLGGGLRNLAHLRIRLWWAAPVALALQALPLEAGESGVSRWLPLATLLLSYAILVVVAAANRRLRGFLIILLGLSANMAVISANQGMPVSPHALERIGHAEAIPELREAPPGAKHRLEREDDVLRPLADVIAVRDPFDAIVSIGDVVAYSGAAVALAAGMLGRATRQGRREAPGGAPPATSS